MKEKLSEFVDGELDAQACDPLVEALRSAPDMRRRWDAYCLIGDALRGDRVGAADFVSRVMNEIDDEPTLMVPAAARAVRQRSAWGRSLMPIAASVMGVAAVGIVALTMFPSSPDPLVQAPGVLAAESAPARVAAAGASTQNVSALASDPSREYMFVHQAMSGGPIPGVVHYVRTVSDARGEQR